MNKTALFFFLVLLQNSIAQNTYSFDYAIEYKQEHNVSKLNKSNIIFLVNTCDNSYYARVAEKDSLNYSFYFKDFNGNFGKIFLEKESFFKAENIVFKCDFVSKRSGYYDYKSEEYDFSLLNDTIIDDKQFYHYKISSNRSLKYQKRKNIGEYHYIVFKDSPDFLPLLDFETTYLNWKKNKNIPNGMLYILYHKKLDGEIVYKMILNNKGKINKKVIIPEECNYSN